MPLAGGGVVEDHLPGVAAAGVDRQQLVLEPLHDRIGGLLEQVAFLRRIEEAVVVQGVVDDDLDGGFGVQGRRRGRRDGQQRARLKRFDSADGTTTYNHVNQPRGLRLVR